MNEVLDGFEDSGFMPHGMCLLWKPDLLLLHSISDGVIALSYYSIPLALIVFAHRRRDLAFRWMFLLFGGFILACGSTHLMSIWTLWHPDYVADGVLKAATAALSLSTALMLWRIMPAALAILGKEQLEVINRDLKGQVESAETAARESERLFRLIAETAVDGIILIDAAGTVLFYNPACEKLFGYPAGEVVGRNVKLLMPPPYSDEHDDYLANFHRTGVRKIIGIGREVEGRRKDGSTFPMHLSVGRQIDDGGMKFVGIMHDLTVRRSIQTERERAEKDMRRLISEMAHMGRLTEMSQMSAAIAHELNQPLSAIASYAGAAKRILGAAGPSDAARAADLIDRVSEQVTRAAQIIRRLRNLVEKGSSDRAPAGLSEIVEEAAKMATLGGEADNISLTMDLAPKLPPLTIDKIQIQQVIMNLIRNALEVLRQSETRILNLQTKRDENGFQEVVVTDSGPGIAPEIADQLFKPFTSTKATGMGVGLSISRSIIEAHGGRIWAEPRPAGGTVFRFSIPPDNIKDDARESRSA